LGGERGGYRKGRHWAKKDEKLFDLRRAYFEVGKGELMQVPGELTGRKKREFPREKGVYSEKNPLLKGAEEGGGPLIYRIKKKKKIEKRGGGRNIPLE